MAIQRKIFKTYYSCVGDTSSRIGSTNESITQVWTAATKNGTVSGSGYVSSPPGLGIAGAYPADLTWNLSMAAVQVYLISLDANSGGAGTYELSFTVTEYDGTQIEYIVQVIVFAECEETITGCETNKGDTNRLIAWQTREGGWSQWLFLGKTTFEVKIPDATKFNRADYITRYADREGVYTGETVTTGSIPKAALNAMESLKYSVQAFVIDDYNGLYPKQIPIVIDAENFIKRKTGDKMFDVSVSFIYGEQVNIQSQ